MLDERLRKQMEFLIEIDKVKNIFRMTYVADGSRHENDAEHSWHMGIMAFLFAEYVGDAVNVNKVIKMVLVHDLVEIYAGDTFAFDEKGYEDKELRERESADKLFGMLPKSQEIEFRALWDEFEAGLTKEAQYGIMLDTMQPLLLNYVTGGGTWKKHNIPVEKVYKRNEMTLKNGPQPLKDLVNFVIEDCIKKGYIK